MRYISWTYALNMGYTGGFFDEGYTPGDWHSPCLDWENPHYAETKDYPWGKWGIEEGVLPGSDPPVKVQKASHARACIDLIADGKYGLAQGMRESYIGNELYTPVVFEKAMLLKDADNWDDIDGFMGKEYLSDWLDFKKQANR